MAYTGAQREREISSRIALGAESRNMSGTVMREEFYGLMRPQYVIRERSNPRGIKRLLCRNPIRNGVAGDKTCNKRSIAIRIIE
jgi:hypothetical protein